MVTSIQTKMTYKFAVTPERSIIIKKINIYILRLFVLFIILDSSTLPPSQQTHSVMTSS